MKREMTLMRKPGLERDLADRHLALAEQDLGAFDATLSPALAAISLSEMLRPRLSSIKESACFNRRPERRPFCSFGSGATEL